jgi:hypothetical protein
MTDTLTMVTKGLQMGFGKNIMELLILLISIYPLIRLLASSKIEITNEMTLKTGNTAMAVKLFEQE